MNRWKVAGLGIGILVGVWCVSPSSDARALKNSFTDLVAQDGGSQFATGQVALITTSGRLVRDTSINRRRLTVFNPGPNDVAVGTGTAILFGNGYIVPAGSERTFYHTAAVFAISSSTNTVTISWEEDQE